MKVVAPSGAGRGVWGWRSPSTTALQFRYPRRGACARIIPTWGLNCRSPSARRGWAALKCAARLPNDGSAAFPCAALVRAFAFLQRARLGLPPPRPIRLCLKLPLRVPSGAGRSSRCVRLAVDVCFALPTDSPRMTGATRSAKQHPSGRLRRCPSGSAYSQNRARRFSFKRAWRKNCRARFTALRRASPPIQ